MSALDRRLRGAIGALAGGVLAIAVACPARGAQLVFSGVLGQSAAAAGTPLPFLEVAGVASDAGGDLWTGANATLYKFTESSDRQWHCTGRVRLPHPLASGIGFKSDGRRIFFELRDHKIYGFDPGTHRLAAEVSLPGTPSVLQRFNGLRLAVSPAHLRRGWARRDKYFVLDTKARAIYAFGRDGAFRGKVLSLPAPTKAKSKYVGITIQPGVGNLLVATNYPDQRVYCFDPEGRPVAAGGWPRNRVPARLLLRSRGRAWALDSALATSLPTALSATSQPLCIPLKWTTYPYGMARDRQGDFWIACSQGLVELDAWGRPKERRLGGLPSVDTVTITPGGVVFATVEQGQRVLRLMLDDSADGVFQANADEPFRVGFGWSQSAADIAWDGQGLLVLGKKDGRLWRFTPKPLRLQWPYRPKPWQAITPAGTFRQPRALAVADDRWWVLDGAGVESGSLADPKVMHAVNLPGLEGTVHTLAAADRSTLILATRHRLSAWRRETGNRYTRLWSTAKRFGEIADVAAKRRQIAVVDSGKQEVLLLDSRSGTLQATLSAAMAPGGMEPTGVALHGQWLLVVDSHGDRLLRFDIRR